MTISPTPLKMIKKSLRIVDITGAALNSNHLDKQRKCFIVVVYGFLHEPLPSSGLEGKILNESLTQFTPRLI